MDTRADDVISPRPSDTGQEAVLACEHGWVTESRHRVLAGVIVYVRCLRCGAWRVDRLGEGGLVAEALSRPVARQRG